MLINDRLEFIWTINQYRLAASNFYGGLYNMDNIMDVNWMMMEPF